MDDVTLRTMTAADLPRLAGWLSQPHVREWFIRSSDLASVTAHYGPGLEGADPTEHFIIMDEGMPVGMIQRYLIDDYEPWAAALPLATGHSAGIDYLIGEAAATHRNIGTTAIAVCVAGCFVRWPHVTNVVVAPQQANRGSWRALERAGFERVWAGQLVSEDPSDVGPAYVYQLIRPTQS